jgi:general secretion pathway protein D
MIRIATIVTALLPSLALAQPLPQPKPSGPGGSCPHGYTPSGSFCVLVGATAAPNGEGYDLNFENAPIATVAKVILGDILGVGYTIDPRVQGTVTLASGRPVPKSELLFVLENALSLSNVALVPDLLGYRLVPAGEAIGTGQVEAVISLPPNGTCPWGWTRSGSFCLRSGNGR